jgi:beta-1,4-N-acetylglucosaminyltransferase
MIPWFFILCNAFAFIIFFAVIRIFYVILKMIRRRQRIISLAGGNSSEHQIAANISINKSTHEPVKTLVILGSGGHTGEMIQFTNLLNRSNYYPLVYIHATTDISSRVRVETIEKNKNNTLNVSYYSIPRSREVGQSYFTSIFTTLYSIVHAFQIIYLIRPQLILCNGPGTCLPLVIIALFYRALIFRPCKIIFLESFCRVVSLSLCGKLLYFCVDRFIVQWPQLAKKYRLAEYIGRLM